MTITSSVRATVAQVLRNKSLSKSGMARALDVKPAWVTKFFDGTLLALDDKKAEALENFLGIKFQRLVPTNQLPAVAVQLGEAMISNPALAEILGGLASLLQPQAIQELPFFDTKELRSIGAEVTKIVHAWEQEDPHYGRIGREVVELLSKKAAAHNRAAAKKSPKKK